MLFGMNETAGLLEIFNEIDELRSRKKAYAETIRVLCQLLDINPRVYLYEDDL